MESNHAEIVGRIDNCHEGSEELDFGQPENGRIDEPIIPLEESAADSLELLQTPNNDCESSSLAMAEEHVTASPNPTPSILIDKYEDSTDFDTHPSSGAAIEIDLQSDMNNSDHSALTNSGAEAKRTSDQEADLDTESEATNHHSRLLRLLSSDLGSTSGAETGARSSPTSPPSASETEAPFLPLVLPGVRLRVRSLRAKDRIPSRVFRSLQQDFDFDSSTEDISQAVVSSPPPLSPQCNQPMASGVTGQTNFFRYSRLYASVTPETPSSATSELEGFFPPPQYPFH